MNLDVAPKASSPPIMLNVGNMDSDPLSLSAILRRIDQRLESLGLSDRAASMAAGLSPGAIRSMRRQCESGSQSSITLNTLQSLSKALYTSPGWLGSGTGNAEGGEHGLAHGTPTLLVEGAVVPGRWLQIDSEESISPHVASIIPADPSYPADAQSAMLVSGSSINRVAQDGDFLICVDLEKSGIEPQSGDLVIVERRRPKDGLRELSARRVWFGKKSMELRFDSLDSRYTDQSYPHYQAPLIVLNEKQAKDEQVTLLALAVRVWRVVERLQK